MKSRRQAADQISFNSAISATEKAGQWEQAVQLLVAMSEESINPDTISFNAAISACARPGEWQIALALAASMDKRGIARDEITYNCVSNACEKASCWQLASDLLLQRNSPTKVGQLVYQICKNGVSALDDLPALTPAEASQVVWRLAKLSRLGLPSSLASSPLHAAAIAEAVVAAEGAAAFDLQELSAVLWSLARLGVLDASLVLKLSQRCTRQMAFGGARGLNIRSMANLAWALSSLPGTDAAGTFGQLQNELAHRAVHLPSESMSQASWIEFATAAFAILYAADFAGQLLPNAARAIRSVLVGHGARMDAGLTCC